MNDCYLNFLVSFRALFSLDVGANLVNSKQTIGIILPDLSLLGYAVPVESFGIGLFVILFTYLIIEYNVQLLSHEKFKIAMNMLHTAHTPLILLRNQLEELKTGNLPEPLSQQVEEALGYAECIIYCNRNIATLNKVNKRIPPKTSTVNLELSTYVTSIVNQCRAHANSRQIRLTVGECSDCVSCRINENIMTAALQHLINKMILISESGCCISINVTHTMNSWQLQISNNEIAGQRAGKMFPFIPIIFPVYGYSDLWTVRKIIRLHGGKITGCRHGKAATFQIVIPTDCHCQNQSCPVLKHSSAKTKTQIDDSCESPKSDKQNTKARETSHILLVMADKLFSDYLKKTLSRYFQISVLDNPELLFSFIEKGDKGAFTQAYDRYHKLLYVLAYRYLMNADMAEDVVQHVFARLWEFRSELHVGISLKNYLFTMTKNHVLNLIRNENSAISKNYEIAQSAPVYEDNLIENLEKKELMASFYKAVDMLPPQKRSICLMKVKEELTNQEIAERMNLSVNTVKTHYSEALKMLRIHLSKMLIIVTFVTLMTYLSVHYLR